MGQFSMEKLALPGQFSVEINNEVARLKELPRRPPDRPSGMEQSTEAGQVRQKKSRSRRRRGATLPRIAISQEVVLPAAAPAGSRSKG
jgi:hypothetical protein